MDKILIAGGIMLSGVTMYLFGEYVGEQKIKEAFSAVSKSDDDSSSKESV